MNIIKSIPKHLFTLIIGAVIITSCNSQAEKVVLAEQRVSESSQELDTANAEYLEGIELYRRETAARIEYNNQTIADFNKRIKSEKTDANAEYKKRVDALAKKNMEMSARLNSYRTGGKETWEVFKTEFTHDMDSLGKAFSDLTVSNVKE